MGQSGPWPQQAGCHVQQQLVHQAFAQERAAQFVACLQVQFVHFTGGQVGQQGGQVCFLLCATNGQRDDGGTRVDQLLPVSWQATSLVRAGPPEGVWLF